MAGAAYRYVTDELTLREVLELMLCHRAWKEEIDEDVMWKRLADFKIDGLAEKILEIAYMWFGEKTDLFLMTRADDTFVYDILEERILTRGIVNRENDEQALKLQNLVEKELEKEKKAEGKDIKKEKRSSHFTELRKKLDWIFPDYHYMSSIYPAVERFPALLPLYWGIRGIRLLWRTIRS